MFNKLLFDLDGTLTDSKPGIINSILFALDKSGLSRPQGDALNEFIGPPLAVSLKRYYDIDDDKIAEVVALYREYYSQKGIFENSVYPGVDKALEYLKSRGAAIYLATSKPEPYAVRIIEHFGLSRFFDRIYGASFDGRISEKSEVVSYALSDIGCKDKSHILMIGDRRYDCNGAHDNGIKCAGVLYGYGTREELLGAGAEFIIETTDDLCRILNL